MNKDFSIEEALKFGWETLKENFGLLIGAGVILMVVQFVPTAIAGMLRESAAYLAILIEVIGWVLSVLVQIGLIKIMLKLCDNQKPVFSEIFSGYNHLWQFIAASILYSLIVMGGMLLLIIPGIIWAISYQFVAYALIDDNLGPIQALKESAELTKGIKGKLILFTLCLGGVNLLGVLLLGIGLIVTVPVSSIAYTYVYRQLRGGKSV